MTWVEISAVSAAAAFIVLVVFVIRTLITARSALQQMAAIAADAQLAVRQTSDQAAALLRQTSGMAEDVNSQLQTMKRCFGQVEQAGAAIGEVASSLRTASRVMNQSILSAEKVVHNHQRRLNDAIEWATTGVELWQRWQAHRQAKADYPRSETTSDKGVEEHV